jgi:hypothetical protein
MTLKDGAENGDALSEAERAANARLARREWGVAILASLIFFWLILCPGKDALKAWDHTTVSLFADAATVSAAIGIPMAVIAGGADLIAWIARVIRRALIEDRRPVIRSGAPGYRPRASFAPLREVLTPRRVRAAGVSLLVVAVVAFAVWGAPKAWNWLGNLWANAPAEAVIDDAGPAEAGPVENGPALPPFCSTDTTGAITCTANADAQSAEALGVAICGREGLGEMIFRANREEHGFTFDAFHVPPGTAFSVECPPLSEGSEGHAG